MVCVFHSLEFYTTIMAHPKTTTSEGTSSPPSFKICSRDRFYFNFLSPFVYSLPVAFLLNHSPEFNIAMAASVIEYILESFFWNKGAGVFKYLAFTGMAIAICGQIFRTVAMHTAGKSFTHLVAKSKTNEHVLVTDGIYSISRHPAYAGWFYWAVFTQLLLCNPICFVAYAFVAFSFFKTRIDWEEDNLLIFFGDKYKDYKKRVPTRIPFLE